MIYTYKYKSPLGHILLAADEVGITGLWFEGQKIWEYTSRQAYSTGNRDSHGKRKNGWMFISPVKNRNLLRHFIRTAQHSDRQCGRFYCRFPMDRRSHTEKLPAKWQR